MPTPEEWRAQFKADLEAMAEERAGFDDMARVDIDKARGAVQAQITAYEQRRLLIVAADKAAVAFEAALSRLRAHGYPNLEPIVTTREALHELDEQQRTWNKARAKFAADPEADQVEIRTAGEQEAQP